MADSLTNPSEKTGLPPGTLVHVGPAPTTAGRVTLYRYTADQFETFPVIGLDDILRHRGQGASLWVHCEGLDMIDLIEAIGRHFNVHPLVLEDILNTHQRPKFEEFDDYLFAVVKVLRSGRALKVRHEQVSFLLFADVLFTFRETADDLFNAVKLRLSGAKGRIRTLGLDYLAYTILDTVVDNYFVLADTMEDAIETAESDLLHRAQPKTFAIIQLLRREMVLVRKAIAPLREMLLALQRSESPLIQERNLPYFRDVFDHTLRVIDTTDSLRDLLNGMLDIYLSSVSNRMNEIMKVLTLFASIFIPLTFIAGVYGMNFDYMPELHWRWAYPALWIFFIALPVFLIYLFKRKKWL
ncbi:magnesium/cobalt transporter CorA [Desulfobulbus sp.]|uniref:magnesium/cobalt transporter CorA n=1 Tax=Desulfobulbus sp. TaxID=895 RepID=UPI00286F2592|nr:magnesium/cobalt transporter CorA [Desulfobulbus sp.]